MAAAVADMVARSSDLKRDLVAFAQRPRYAKTFRRFAAESDVEMVDEGQLITMFDSFVLQHQMPDGRTLVEHFVDSRPDLSEDDRELLLSWRDVVDGLFEVERRDGDALLLHNLIDELTYRVHSNLGPSVFAGMPRKSFLVARLVPVGDEWLFSGHQAVIPASAHREAAKIAAEFSMQRPALVFRNPEKLERGWELQRADRADFIEFFGVDLVVLAGRDVAERMRAFWEFRMRRIAADTGHGGGTPPPAPSFEEYSELADAQTVGLIYDETEGLLFLENFGLFAEAFDEPDRAGRKPYRGIVRTYLDDDTVSPVAFRRVAERDPAKASRVFQLLLKRPGFSWESDGEALLRRHKASFFDTPPLPHFTPASGRVLEYFTSMSARG